MPIESSATGRRRVGGISCTTSDPTCRRHRSSSTSSGRSRWCRPATAKPGSARGACSAARERSRSIAEMVWFGSCLSRLSCLRARAARHVSRASSSTRRRASRPIPARFGDDARAIRRSRRTLSPRPHRPEKPCTWGPRTAASCAISPPNAAGSHRCRCAVGAPSPICSPTACVSTRGPPRAVYAAWSQTVRARWTISRSWPRRRASAPLPATRPAISSPCTDSNRRPAAARRARPPSI